MVMQYGHGNAAWTWTCGMDMTCRMDFDQRGQRITWLSEGIAEELAEVIAKFSGS